MSRSKIVAARQLLVAPGPFDIADLVDPHDGTPVARLHPARARKVVGWYRRILCDSQSLAAPELFTDRLAVLDRRLAEGATVAAEERGIGVQGE
jgi:hypothetical protein